MIVRAAGLEELEAVSAIYDDEVLHGTATFDTEPRNTAAREAWFHSHQNSVHPLLVAVETSLVLGWGSLTAWSARPAYARTVEASVFVGRAHRRQGVGSQLLASLLGRARKADHRVVLGRIEASNEGSRGMLVAAGFRSVGVMHAVGEKFGRTLDVELFELMLR